MRGNIHFVEDVLQGDSYFTLLAKLAQVDTFSVV